MGPGHGGARDPDLWRRRCVRVRERADAVDLVARDWLRAALHLDGAEIDVIDVAPQLAERLGAACDLVATRDVGRRETRGDVGGATDHGVLRPPQRAEEAGDDVTGVDAEAE